MTTPQATEGLVWSPYGGIKRVMLAGRETVSKVYEEQQLETQWWWLMFSEVFCIQYSASVGVDGITAGAQWETFKHIGAHLDKSNE